MLMNLYIYLNQIGQMNLRCVEEKHSVLSIAIMTNGNGYDENNQDV